MACVGAGLLPPYEQSDGWRIATNELEDYMHHHKADQPGMRSNVYDHLSFSLAYLLPSVIAMLRIINLPP
jgi:hypothetical protein